MLALTLIFISSGVFGFTKQEVIDHTLKLSLVRHDYSEAYELERRLTEDNCSQEIADFAAQLLSIRINKSAVNIREYGVLLGLLEKRDSNRYQNLLQSILDANKSYELNDLVRLTMRTVDSDSLNEEPFVATSDDFLTVRHKLLEKARLSSRTSNWNEQTRVDVENELKQLATMEEVYNRLGFPSSLDIGFKRGRTGIVGVLVLVWQDRVRINFNNKLRGKRSYPGNTWYFLNTLKLDGVNLLEDYSNDLEIEKMLTSKDPKPSKVFLRAVHKHYVLSKSTLDTMEKIIQKNILNFDKKWTKNLILMCRNLGGTKDPKYLDTLHRAATLFTDNGLKAKANQALYKLLAETDSIAELNQSLQSGDPNAIRLAARAIHTQKMLTPEMSKIYIAALNKNHESKDKTLVSAMVTMLRSFSVSDRIDSIPDLKLLRGKLKNKDLIAHADKAITKLKSVSYQVQQN